MSRVETKIKIEDIEKSLVGVGFHIRDIAEHEVLPHDKVTRGLIKLAMEHLDDLAVIMDSIHTFIKED